MLHRDDLIGLVGLIVAVGIPLLIWWLDTRRKQLTYRILRSNLFAPVGQELEGRVELLVDGVKTSNVAFLIVTLQNTGNEPIRREDFEIPFTVHFGEFAEIISSEVIATEPEDFMAHLQLVTTGMNKCHLNPCLLNPGDSITMKLMARNVTEQFAVDARVAGVKELKGAVYSSIYKMRPNGIYAIAMIVVAMVGTAVLMHLAKTRNLPFPIILGMSFFSYVTGAAVIMLANSFSALREF